jgi:2-polyprenyl-3-methyl-5-hydroxy-6-metoxy-1,4-benzoquinol methylase
MPFGTYRRRAAAVARDIAERLPTHALDEQAVPAYTQGNPLSRAVFWRRLRLVRRYLARFEGGRCMDFGCGLGIALPILADVFDRIEAVDVDLAHTAEFLEGFSAEAGPLPAEVRLWRSVAEADIEPGSLDLILALDVLEHVDDLPREVAGMAERLRPGGVLLVSGPTENWLYRLGRRIVGFSGEYHVRNIRTIREEIRTVLPVRVLARVPFALDLFHLLECRKGDARGD